MENNKKNLILSIIGIIVLVIAVIGVSFAMYTYTGNGTKENTIQTGTISMSFNPDNNFVVSGQYPMTDSKGIATTTNKATFGVTANWGTAKMTINYDLGLTAIQAGTTLTEQHIKVALLDGEGAVLTGTEENGKLSGGVTIASLANKAGTHGLIKNYALTSGTITASGTTDNYTILAYVADTYDLPTDKANTTTDNTGNITTSGLYKEQTGSETFKFKITIKASQVTGEENSNSNVLLDFDKSKLDESFKVLFEYDKEKDGIMLEDQYTIASSKILDNVWGYDIHAIKISNELWDHTKSKILTFQAINSSTGQKETVVIETSPYAEYENYYRLDIPDALMGFMIVHTPFVDGADAMKPQFSTGTWFTAWAYQMFNNLEYVKIEELTASLKTYTDPDMGTFYKINDRVITKEQLIGTTLTATTVDGTTDSMPITEDDITTQGGLLAIMGGMAIVANTGDSEMDGCWIHEDAFNMVSNMKIERLD